MPISDTKNQIQQLLVGFAASGAASSSVSAMIETARFMATLRGVNDDVNDRRA